MKTECPSCYFDNLTLVNAFIGAGILLGYWPCSAASLFEDRISNGGWLLREFSDGRCDVHIRQLHQTIPMTTNSHLKWSSHWRVSQGGHSAAVSNYTLVSGSPLHLDKLDINKCIIHPYQYVHVRISQRVRIVWMIDGIIDRLVDWSISSIITFTSLIAILLYDKRQFRIIQYTHYGIHKSK